MPNQPILIFGCGGHSRSVADILLSDHPDVKLVFVDPNAESEETLFGFEVLPELPYSPNSYFFALGDNFERKKKYEEIYTNNLKNREFDKKGPQNFCSERATIAERQGASENKNAEAAESKKRSEDLFLAEQVNEVNWPAGTRRSQKPILRVVCV